MRRALVTILMISLLGACSSGGGSNPRDTASGQDTSALDSIESQDTVSCQVGEPCDDGDPCTTEDQCVDGLCAGVPITCEAAPDCADSQCDGLGGCTLTLKEGWCLLQDDTCVAAGEGPDQCRICNPELSTSDLSPRENGEACEDGNICTENDYCDNGTCVAGSPPTCADGIECTVDACDPETGCSHTPDHEQCRDASACTVDTCDLEAGCLNTPDDELTCSDDNVCTTGDHCEDGVCVVDEQEVQCGDDNLCTDEECHPTYGCIYTFNNDLCNDGASCTMGDTCHFGKCIGQEPNQGSCPTCDIDFSQHVQKINAVAVGSGGIPGQALDVDGDFKTCAPADNCESGLDNALAFAGELINPTIVENLANPDNPLIFVAELKDPSLDGEEFTVNLLYAVVAPSNENCDFMNDVCFYLAAPMNYDPLCNPQVTLTNATIVDHQLKAGGSGFIFPFMMSFVGGTTAELVLYNARLEAQVETSNEGRILSMTGVLAGAVTKSDIGDMVNAIPDDYLSPQTKDLILNLVLENMPNDIDVDGDGTADGVSIGLPFSTIPGKLEPYQF